MRLARAAAAGVVRAERSQPPVAGAVEGDDLVPLGVVGLDVDAFVHCSALPCPLVASHQSCERARCYAYRAIASKDGVIWPPEPGRKTVT